MAPVLGFSPMDFAGLAVLRDLGVDGLSRLTEDLSKATVLLGPSELVPFFARHVSSNAMAASDVMVKVAFAARATGKRVSSLVSDVTENIRLRATPPWSPEELSRWTAISPQVCALAEHERLRVLTKAIDLKYAHSNIYQRAQLITDVRPVFDAARDRPVAAVISHTLQVVYNRDGNRETLTLALDDLDVDELIEQANAAKQKAECLAKYFAAKLGEEMRFQIVGKDEGNDES